MRRLIPLLIPVLYACGSFGDSTDEGASSSGGGASSGTSGTASSSGVLGTSSSSGTNGTSGSSGDDSGLADPTFCGAHADALCEDFEGKDYNATWPTKPSGKFLATADSLDTIQKKVGKVVVANEDWGSGFGHDAFEATFDAVQSTKTRAVTLDLAVRTDGMSKDQRVDIGEVATATFAVRLYLVKEDATTITVKIEQYGVGEMESLNTDAAVGTFVDGDKQWTAVSLNVQLSDGSSDNQVAARVKGAGPTAQIVSHAKDVVDNARVSAGLTRVKDFVNPFTYFVDNILVTPVK